ncbi:hypothetical protein [Mycetocola spongiae]|uniref:hypothetical protein n=1 Tax=Mycetocola spongiae TaxID=2859226 RepID=UPI001CF4C731|nr:hypothetical protein [Mycetocola spongiae]UCR88736.1 hypothetical protein KXZ72_12360 [Mycetocola spongiae]
MFAKNVEVSASGPRATTLIAAACSAVGILGIIAGLVLVGFAVYHLSPTQTFIGLGVLIASLIIHAIGVFVRFRTGTGRRVRRG